MMHRQGKLLVNGSAAATVSAVDRGLQYGDGLFETLAVRAGQPLLWERHMARLQEGCRRLGMSCITEARLYEEALSVCADAPRAVLKMVLTRGAGGRGYRYDCDSQPTRIVGCWPWPDYPEHYAREGIAVRLCNMRLSRNAGLAGIKHLNRLEQVLARAEWQDEFAEGLMQDESGCVVEGTMSNLFIVQGGTLVTPDLSQAGVRGIMRECVRECASARGILCTERTIALEALAAADEMFVTNSIIGLWPVKTFATRSYSIGRITQTLQAEIAARGYTANGN